jgi:hypothetical protein
MAEVYHRQFTGGPGPLFPSRNPTETKVDEDAVGRSRGSNILDRVFSGAVTASRPVSSG